MITLGIGRSQVAMNDLPVLEIHLAGDGPIFTGGHQENSSRHAQRDGKSFFGKSPNPGYVMSHNQGLVQMVAFLILDAILPVHSTVDHP